MELPHSNNIYLLRVAAVTLLIIGCLAVLTPFVGTLLLAIVVCVSSWPLYSRLRALLGNRPTLAALSMCLILILILLLPMIVLSGSLANAIEMAREYIGPLFKRGLAPKAPDWLANLPIVGQEIGAYWRKVAGSSVEMNKLLQQFVEPARKLLLTTVTLLGQGLLQVGLVIFFAFFIFRDAETYAEGLKTIAQKLGGKLGERMLKMAEGTVQGVMIGIVGTAAAQAVVGCIGYLIAGVPAVLILTFATFIFSMVPVIGATLIWAGAAGWLYQDGQTGWAIFMALYGVFAISGVDNFVKPILISRTSALPLLLIIVGVFGGVLVFGFIGLFLGPTLLALGSTLLREWMGHKDVANLPSELEG